MKKVYVKPINKVIELNKNVNSIIIESPSLLRSIYFDLNNNIIYSINNIPFELEKIACVIKSPLDLDLNEVKIIKNLYKKLEKHIIEEKLEKLNIIESKLFELIDEVIEDTIIPVECNEKIDIQKLLGSLSIAYRESSNYLERLCDYIRLHNEINSKELFISFGLLNLLDESEIDILNKELSYLNVCLFDIIFVKKEIKYDIIIDEDWCVL